MIKKVRTKNIRSVTTKNTFESLSLAIKIFYTV